MLTKRCYMTARHAICLTVLNTKMQACKQELLFPMKCDCKIGWINELIDNCDTTLKFVKHIL